MATHSSVLAWRIPGTGEPGELPSEDLREPLVRRQGSQVSMCVYGVARSWTRLKRHSSSSSSSWCLRLAAVSSTASLGQGASRAAPGNSCLHAHGEEASPGDLPNPGIELRYPALQVDSLLSEPPGKPKNTGKGSLSLLKGIFPTQESNQGLLPCRRISYCPSHQGQAT